MLPFQISQLQNLHAGLLIISAALTLLGSLALLCFRLFGRKRCWDGCKTVLLFPRNSYRWVRVLIALPEVILEKQSAHDREFSEIKAQFSRNGGSSLKDDIYSLRHDIRSFNDKLKFVDHLSPKPLFEMRFNPEGRIMCYSVNPAMCAMLDRDESDLLGANWLAIIDDDEKRRVTDMWRFAVENKTVFDSVQTIKFSDKEKRRIHVYAVPNLDPQGEVYRYLGCLGWAG